MLNTSDVPLESYRVIKIKHFLNNNEYYNEITGVPKDQEIAHYIDENATPLGEEQYAVVTDNHDTSGMNRIRVQFAWQKDTNEKSPWIRLLTPYAGNNKGLHIIPEIGEEVLVGFENNNAEKPFVLGSMFNGSEKSSLGDSKNNIKCFSTRSGHIIQLNDDESSLGITIKDKNDNIIHLDTKSKNIEINAPEAIILTSKNINLKASENINIESGNEYNLISKVGFEKFTKDLTIEVKEELKESSGKHEIENKEILMISTSDMKMKSGNIDFGV